MRKFMSILLMMTIISASSAFALEVRGREFGGTTGSFNRTNLGRRSGIYNLSAQNQGVTPHFVSPKAIEPKINARKSPKVAAGKAAVDAQFQKTARHLAVRNYDRKAKLNPARNVRTFGSNESAKQQPNGPVVMKAKLGLKEARGGMLKTDRKAKMVKTIVETN